MLTSLLPALSHARCTHLDHRRVREEHEAKALEEHRRPLQDDQALEAMSKEKGTGHDLERGHLGQSKAELHCESEALLQAERSRADLSNEQGTFAREAPANLSQKPLYSPKHSPYEYRVL